MKWPISMVAATSYRTLPDNRDKRLVHQIRAVAESRKSNKCPVTKQDSNYILNSIEIFGNGFGKRW